MYLCHDIYLWNMLGLYFYILYLLFFFAASNSFFFFFFFSSRRRHTRWNCDWSSDVCSSDLQRPLEAPFGLLPGVHDAVEGALRNANRYPDPSNMRLRQALAARFDHAPEDRKSVV